MKTLRVSPPLRGLVKAEVFLALVVLILGSALSGRTAVGSVTSGELNTFADGVGRGYDIGG
jgi:hypothetical protein